MTDDEVLQASLERIRGQRLVEVVGALVDVPSPTGHERPLAELVTVMLADAGLEAHLQPLDADQASAWGRLRGARTGQDLLLYAPIDTWSTGRADVDVPWVGDHLEPHMLPRAHTEDGVVSGLGAMNPKGHAACILVAAEVIAATGVELAGDLLVAFGAGGMPTNAWDDRPRRNVGQGVGASYLLEQGVWADHAVIAKSFWGVSSDEVGLAWLDVTLRGTHTYVGARHRLPYRNPVVVAAEAVPVVEEWIASWSTRTAAGEVEPQAAISAVRGGLPRMVAGIPASTTMRLDVRLAPGVDPLAPRRSLASHLADAGIDADVELALSVPGSSTPTDAPVHAATVAAWEAIEGRSHSPPERQSGATDANILRNRGIPTVRVGLPKVVRDGAELGYSAGMNTVEVEPMQRLTQLLVRVALDLCDRPRRTTDP